MKPANTVMNGLGTTVFEVMSRLAIEHGSINLGQGFPDQDGPQDVRQAAADALMAGPNQYPPMAGLPELRQAIARHAKRFYDLDVDWQSEVVVTSGATEALADCFFGLLNPGDEVVLLEPLYDSYAPIVERAGAVPRFVRLEPPEWSLPLDELSRAFGPKTKAVLLNTPMNPASKVFGADELRAIAGLCIAHDVVAICDEVYEHLVFDGAPHVPLIGLPGMRERCLKIGSAGKIFSLTGWKVGWIVGAPDLLAPIMKTHQFMTFTTAPNLQKAVAYGLDKDDAYFATLAGDMQAKRDRLTAGLAHAGFDVLPSAGTYFVSADFRPLGFNGTDEEFCRLITLEAGVTAVPVSAFYRSGQVRHLARFCFSKQDAILDDASRRLARRFAA